jgi:aminopeptidase YwaD
MKLIRSGGISDSNGRIVMLIVLPLLLSGILLQETCCQDSTYERTVINRLCSERMHGRGFVKNGDLRAARYIASEWATFGLKPVGDDFFQYFKVDINTFPAAMKIELNGHTLIPGSDYLIDPASPGMTGHFVPFSIRPSDLMDQRADSLLKEARGRVVLLDSRELRSSEPPQKEAWNELIRGVCTSNPYGMKALIEVSEAKLTFDVASRLSSIPHFVINARACPGRVSSVRFHVKNQYITGYRTQNVIGFVPGRVCPDSFLVFTAHYDHLGMMGKHTYFPGANDNSSGVAMLLNLSRYFSLHPQRFSVVFISFSGEELGLAGSGYFTENPLIRLSSVKFLINLDIVGTGSEGITVVNAPEFPVYFDRLTAINENARLIHGIKKRGTACNSDHCPFFSKGVPCFFIYTMGGIAAYHDVNDCPETLPLTAFQGLSKLLIRFAGTF